MRVTVIGDSTLDVTVRPAAAPRAGGDTSARISLSPGGQGANVAVRLARAGMEVRLATAVAEDEVGRLLSAALEADGVALVRLATARSGLVVSLLDTMGERTMLSDRVSLDPSQMAAAAAGAEWVHCSGYALADDAAGDPLAETLGSLPPAIRVSAGGGSLPDDTERSGRVRRRLASAGVDLLVMGRDEARLERDHRPVIGDRRGNLIRDPEERGSTHESACSVAVRACAPTRRATSPPSREPRSMASRRVGTSGGQPAATSRTISAAT